MTPRTVLVVEDNPVARKLLRVTLESHGCAVREAGDGAAALAQLEPPPDLVVQDLMLPDVDGIALCSAIRTHPGCEAVPVIAISGHTERLYGHAADCAGFAERLPKPVGPSQLLGAVRNLLPEAADAPRPQAPVVLVADDTAIQRKLTVLRCREAGYEVLEAADGIEALAIISERQPDAVIADVLMPGLDGFELCRAVRADPAVADIKVVLASSVFIDGEDRELSERAGADCYVAREPDHATILEALRRALIDAHPRAPDDDGFRSRYADRVGLALQRESAAHAAVAEQLDARDTQLSVLAGIADILAHANDPIRVIEEILARSLEAAGVAGARYVPSTGGEDGSVTVGDPPLFDPETITAAARADVTVLAGDGLVIAVRSHGRELGAVLLGSRDQPLGDSQLAMCRAIASQLAQAIALARTQAEIVASRDLTIERLARAVALRDGETGEHTERMSSLCELIGHQLALGRERCLMLRSASAMHDIGKVATPDAILRKQGRLTPDERAVIEQHAETGHVILGGSGSELLELAATIALSHHERWDGTGYPRRLQGTQIPIEARIAAVADVYDALTSDRPYRPAMSVEAALEVMRAGRGTHFDPLVLDAFLRVHETEPGIG